MGSFAMAMVGLCSGQSPFTCAVRALIGAAVMFVVVTMAGRLAISVLVHAVISGQTRPPQADNDAGAAEDEVNG